MSELFGPDGPFATGIDEVDSEHAALHAEAKRLAVLFAEPTAHEGIENDAEAFLKQLEEHFQHEEKHFKKLEPERAKKHIHEHSTILLSLRLFVQMVKDQESIDLWNAFINLEDVLLKHIIMFDLDFRHRKP